MAKVIQQRGNSPIALITKARRRNVYQACAGRCFYCGLPVSEHGVTPDRDWLMLKDTTMVLEHKNPVIRGGGNERANITCSCRSCNATKASFTLDEFRFLRALRSGTLDFKFSGEEPAALKRDWLLCHTPSFERDLVVHNRPSAEAGYRMPRTSHQRSKTWRPMGAPPR